MTGFAFLLCLATISMGSVMCSVIPTRGSTVTYEPVNKTTTTPSIYTAQTHRPKRYAPEDGYAVTTDYETKPYVTETTTTPVYYPTEQTTTTTPVYYPTEYTTTTPYYYKDTTTTTPYYQTTTPKNIWSYKFKYIKEIDRAVKTVFAYIFGVLLTPLVLISKTVPTPPVVVPPPVVPVYEPAYQPTYQ